MVRDRHGDLLARAIGAGEDRLELSTVSGTSRQTKLRFELRISAPGSRPVSVSTWKPLQMPITGVPRSAASTTACTTGERAAMAPQRR
jgi:hypothetical protein